MCIHTYMLYINDCVLYIGIDFNVLYMYVCVCAHTHQYTNFGVEPPLI